MVIGSAGRSGTGLAAELIRQLRVHDVVVVEGSGRRVETVTGDQPQFRVVSVPVDLKSGKVVLSVLFSPFDRELDGTSVFPAHLDQVPGLQGPQIREDPGAAAGRVYMSQQDCGTGLSGGR